MSEYQLQIKQIVDYPRCRIYRQFIQSLMSDQSIRVGGGSGLFILWYFAAMQIFVHLTGVSTESAIRFIQGSGSVQ